MKNEIQSKGELKKHTQPGSHIVGEANLEKMTDHLIAAIVRQQNQGDS